MSINNKFTKMSFNNRNLCNLGYAQEGAVTEPNTYVDDDAQLVSQFAALSIDDEVKAHALKSSLGKRKWNDTDMSNEEEDPLYFKAEVKQPVFIDYINRYVHVIPTVEVELEDGEILEEEEEDTRMDVVKDDDLVMMSSCKFQREELEDGEILEDEDTVEEEDMQRLAEYADIKRRELKKLQEEKAEIQAKIATVKEQMKLKEAESKVGGGCSAKPDTEKVAKDFGDIILEGIKSAYDKFREENGRDMTYSEMRERYG